MYKLMFIYMSMYAINACKCGVTERICEEVRLSALRSGQVKLFVMRPNDHRNGSCEQAYPSLF